LDQIFQKLRGKAEGLAQDIDIHELQEEYEKFIADNKKGHDDQNQIVDGGLSDSLSAVDGYVKALKTENEHLKKTTVDNQLLPMATQLLCIK